MPRAVPHHALLVCFWNPQHFYENVFVIGVDLQAALIVRRDIFIFFHLRNPNQNSVLFQSGFDTERGAEARSTGVSIESAGAPVVNRARAAGTAAGVIQSETCDG